MKYDMAPAEILENDNIHHLRPNQWPHAPDQLDE